MLSKLSSSAHKPRARDIGIPFDGITGKYNAITDVKGVEAGFSTIISGEANKTDLGKALIRTGVTAILPRGKNNNPVYANWYSLNGNGEMTGTTWITESGFLETPIMITNTNSVGVVRDAVLKWFIEKHWYNENLWYTYPVVAETFDGFMSDIYGFHVKESNAFEALNAASSGYVKEGNVGGGTRMICLGFKGGTGTSSRVVKIKNSSYTVGVLVQSNFGKKNNLTIAGVPVGKELKDANASAFKRDSLTKVDVFPNDLMNPLFEATVQSVEEAIINAMVAAETMEGTNGNKAYALPHDLVIDALRKYNRMSKLKIKK